MSSLRLPAFQLGVAVGRLAALTTTHWIHDLSPFLIEFSNGFGIRYYGLAYLLGFVSGWWLLRQYHRQGRSPLGPEAQADLLLALVVGVMAGGRLGFFLLYHPGQLLEDPLALFKVWEGGMASHGGFVGVLVAGGWVARRCKVPLATLADIVCTLAPPGLLFGRVANFINGELWGRVSDVRWAVIFPQSAPHLPPHLVEPRHPSQLYEAFAEGLVLLLYTQLRFRMSATVRRQPGRLCGEFLVGYAIARSLCELFREGDAGIAPILGMNRGAFYSIALATAGIALIAWAVRTSAKTVPVAQPAQKAR